MTEKPDISCSQVLIVDDAKENIDFLRSILQEEGFQLYFAMSGNKAVEIATQIKPDLILLDMIMPGMDGLETCKKIKSIPQLDKTSIVFVTAKADLQYLVRGFEAGANDYLTKPLRREEVIVRVKNQLAIVAYQKSLAEANLKLTILATKDGLTGLSNRRYFDQMLDMEWRRMKRESHPLSLLLIDVDYFKLYNDTYGHLKGDDCLIEVANTLVQCINRPGDFVARYGGEEFVVVLPNTNPAGALNIAEAMSAAVTRRHLEHSASKVSDRVTVSIGVVTEADHSHPASQAEILEFADTALYQAKQAGRNCIEVYQKASGNLKNSEAG